MMNTPMLWASDMASLAFDEPTMRAKLERLDLPVYVVNVGGRVGLTHEGNLSTGNGHPLLGYVQPVQPESLGDPDLCPKLWCALCLCNRCDGECDCFRRDGHRVRP